jgi:hypothetical protein
MYNYSVNVKYLDLKDEDKALDVFQSCFLEVFNITLNNFDRIDAILDTIYENIKDKSDFSKLLKIRKKLIYCKKDRDFMGLLFSYQSFEFFHAYLNDCKNNKINEENLEKLIKSLEYLGKN